jgi:DNA invertase Pin-like site-specific DNA recombinase
LHQEIAFIHIPKARLLGHLAAAAAGYVLPQFRKLQLGILVVIDGVTIAKEYVDHGVSGSKESRPALDRMMSDAQRRRFDILLVWKLGRFARSLKFLVVSLAELAALGVAFVSLRDNLDLSTPMGRFTAQLLGAMAEFEKELIRERVQAGLDRRKNDLQTRGWFTSKRGNRCSNLGRRRVNVDVVRIGQLRAQGCSWRAIARELGVGEGTVRGAALLRAKNVSEIGTGNALVSVVA